MCWDMLVYVVIFSFKELQRNIFHILFILIVHVDDLVDNLYIDYFSKDWCISSNSLILLELLISPTISQYKDKNKIQTRQQKKEGVVLTS